jgi:nicotinamidase-related amidase
MPTSRKSKRSSDEKNEDLHGNAPDRAEAVLLLVDVINDLTFPDNDQLVRKSESLGKAIARLKIRCKRAGIPAVYVNDNHGKWQSNFASVLKHCLRPEAPGAAMVKLLVPDSSDYVILKPKHSAFFGTPLETILQYIRARTVILTGLTTNACVMLTAGELYVRDFRIIVPTDCVAALTDNDQRESLQIMKRNYGVRTTMSSKLRLSDLK